ncbi:MAG TPA: hypothetical protein VKA21_10685, partial [Candidatus Binatia bacterium]|nr:hypothetical protein [Candidatus Binatia bacterium]
MSRARGFAALAVALTGVWAAALALHLERVASGRLAWVGVWVRAAEAPDRFPAIDDVWAASNAAHADLHPGDRLLRAGGLDLRGVGPVGFVARAYETAGRDLAVALALERDGATRETVLRLTPVAYPWRVLPLTVALVVCAGLVLLRRGPDRVGRAFFFAAIAFSLHWTFFPGGVRTITYAWAAVFACASTVMFPLALRPLLLLPPDVAPAGRLPAWPWLFAVFGPLSTSWVFGTPFPGAAALRGVFAVNVAFIATLLAVVTRNYRRAGRAGRRQLRWVVYGLYVGTVPVAAADVVSALRPALWWTHDVAAIAEAAIPLCVLVAIVRANLFDVDRLISATAAYTLLSVVVVTALLTVVPAAARAASSAAGIPAGHGEL